jgi:hypothetical protein
MMKKLVELLPMVMFGVIFIAINQLPNAVACGGFFCSTTPIDQNAERIIFTINGDGTITAIVGINYVGEAEDFSWIVPVPSVPELDVAETNTINQLDFFTQVSVTAPDYFCGPAMPAFVGFGGGGGGGPVLDQGAVGPYNYAVLGSEDPDEMITWLRENNYQVTPEMEPLIDVYVQEGMYFLAMKLQTDAEVSDIQPIVMTYESENPMIPLRLTAVAAVDNMPVITWIFADEQYVPINYAHPSVDFGQLRQPSEVLDTGRYRNTFYRASTAYTQDRNGLLQSFDGRAFVTEFALPTSVLAEMQIGDEHLDKLIEEFPYVTRLYGRLSPEQMTIDPIFMPDGTAADVSNTVDLDDYVDPISYYGCSTRSAIPDDDLQNVPASHTRVDELQFDIAHPDDWQLSTFLVENNVVDSPDDLPVWVLSPEAVELETIAAYFAGEDTPPMFVFSEMFGWVDFDLENNPEAPLLLGRLGQDVETVVTGVEAHNAIRVRYISSSDRDNYGGVMFGLLTSEDDWAENGILYDAMLAYASAFQYYSNSDFQHTLFLLNYFTYEGRLEAAYPSNWIEHTASDGSIYIAPDAGADYDARTMPFLRLVPLESVQQDWQAANAVNPGIDFSYDAVFAFALERMVNEYGLQDVDDWQAYLNETRETCDFDGRLAFDINYNGRSGKVRLTHSFIVEYSLPEGFDADYEDTLVAMYAHVLENLENSSQYFFRCNLG